MQMTLCCATCVGKAANCIYPNKVVVDNAADMESAVAVDHVCATYTGNRRGNSNFIESDVIPMDIDNDHSDNPADWITEDKMEELFGDVDYALVPSRHHMLAKEGKSERPRYHACLLYRGQIRRCRIMNELANEANKKELIVPVCEKYTLTIREAAAYFNIGIKKMRRLAEENTGRFSVFCGNKFLIIRPKFEKFIDDSSEI